MRSINSQAARVAFNSFQALILVAFVGIVIYAVGAMETARAAPPKAPEKMCVTHKTWLILPFAFLTGGLMNIDGFASTAVLLL
mmetsp:Transcript_100086/g.283484  ORF Transcript_100086/g.283484 Transcript_100086/m.283484 type:complete len:83 (-) Transcript_100086:293-541(-)